MVANEVMLHMTETRGVLLPLAGLLGGTLGLAVGPLTGLLGGTLGLAVGPSTGFGALLVVGVTVACGDWPLVGVLPTVAGSS